MKKTYTKSQIQQLLMKKIIEDFGIDGPLKKDALYIEVTGDFPERVDVQEGLPERLKLHKKHNFETVRLSRNKKNPT